MSPDEYEAKVFCAMERMGRLLDPLNVTSEVATEEDVRVLSAAYIAFGLRLSAFYIATLQDDKQRADVTETSVEAFRKAVASMAKRFSPPPPTASKPAPVKADGPAEPASTPAEQAVAERDMLEALAKISKGSLQ